MVVSRFFVVARLTLAAFVVSLAACSGGSSTLTPVRPTSPASPRTNPTATAFASPSPSATPSTAPNPNATLAPAAVATALADVQTLFAALPHTSLASDLQTLATQMTTSGKFKKAVVNPGGITAILPDGTTAIIFADRLEDVSPSGAANARARAAQTTTRNDLPMSAINSHEIAFLVNDTDGLAFTPSHQAAYANAFTARGFTSANGYGVDQLDLTLDNVAALAGRGIDLLDVATHGSVAGLGPLFYYSLLSDTPVSAANSAKYAKQIAAGSIQYGTYLSLITTKYIPAAMYSITPDFFASTLTFNPGAFFDNQSCFGYSPVIAASVKSSLSAAGVGNYLGWTKPVDGADADGTDGFLFDRLLGEQLPATGLSALAPQQMIPQQPFALADVYPVLNTENRNSPFQQPGPGYPYTNSDSAANAAYPPTAAGNVSGFNGFYSGAVSSPPLEYNMPSISQLKVTENPAAPTMEIFGEFPPMPGTATITDSSSAHALTVTNWSTTEIDVTLPGSGAGSSGDVQVLAASGIGSNTVPLTQWTGSFAGTETDSWGTDNGIGGDGGGTIGSQFNVDFRADVHPFVPSPDASPIAQNLAFSNVENDSTGTVTAYSGTFNSTSQNIANSMMPLQVTYSLGTSAAVMPVSLKPVIAPGFAMGAVSLQPTPCNDGASGQTNSGTSNIFCPGIGFSSSGVNACVDNQSGLGCSASADPISAFSDGTVGEGTLLLTMNPNTYAISVTSVPISSFTSHNFVTDAHTASGNVTGTVGPPIDPPKVTTPVTTAARRARGLAQSRPR